MNNAGVEFAGGVGDLAESGLRQMLEVNAVAPILLMQGLLPSLRASPAASVINVTSIHQDVPVRGNLGYCASKAALAMASRTAALELGRDGIPVNNLAPGAIETDHNRDLIAAVGRGRFESWIPAGRLGRPDDVAELAVFLAGDRSRYVTGTTFVCDDGYTDHLVRYDD